MANVVYVGNYPNTLSDEDILDIFEDFEGLVLLRSLRKARKCYSFILCQDQEQVIEVVFALNGIDVCGRNLIVRASDDELQEVIDQCEREDTSYESYAANKEVPSEGHQGSSNSNYRQPRKPSRLSSAKGAVDTSNQIDQNLINPKNGVATRERYETADSVISEASCSETGSFRSFSPCSSAASTCQRQQRKGEKFSFVSIVNFPDGTTNEELKEMFSDYNPFKIIIQNQFSDHDQPTEAVICFLRSKDATSSILNLDNTLYHGRVILVTEFDDVSLISDLMKVHC